MASWETENSRTKDESKGHFGVHLEVVVEVSSKLRIKNDGKEIMNDWLDHCALVILFIMKRNG